MLCVLWGAYVRSFCSSLLSHHSPLTAARPCEHPLSWRFGAGAAGGCPWPLLTMGRSSWAAFMSCGDGDCPCGDPAVPCPTLTAPWQLEAWEAPGDPVCTTLKRGLWVQGFRVRGHAVQAGFHLQVAVLCFKRLTLILFIARVGNYISQVKGQILETVIANRYLCPKKPISLPPRQPCVHESLPTGKCPLHTKVKLLSFEICLCPAKHHHCSHYLDGIG